MKVIIILFAVAFGYILRSLTNLLIQNRRRKRMRMLGRGGIVYFPVEHNPLHGYRDNGYPRTSQKS